MSKYLPLNLFIRQALLYPLTAPFLPPVDKVEKDYKYAAGRLVGTLEAGVGGLPFTGRTVTTQVGDDAYYQKGLTLTRPIVKGTVGNTRFVDNADGTITDLATGLMWVKDPIAAPGAPFDAKMSWANAIINCEALVFATYNDWRSPNIKELISIIDYQIKAAPSIDTIFSNTESFFYWSGTRSATAANVAWSVYFSNASIYAKTWTSEYWSRPVRLGLP